MGLLIVVMIEVLEIWGDVRKLGGLREGSGFGTGVGMGFVILLW
jgi:hypothetical protein